MRPFSIWLLASVLGSGSALAQDVSPDDDERARIHFESGRTYFEDGAYERAEAEFRDAYELSHRPELLMNEASALERLGRWVEAADLMQRFLDEADDVPNRSALERRIANLRARASREAASSSGDGSGNGTDGGDPGVAPPEPSGNGRTIGAAVAFGAAGAGVVAFAVLGGLALAERSSLENGCGAARACTDDEVSGLRGLALGADIGLVVAGVGAIAGVLVLLLVSNGEEAPATALAPWVAPGGGGLAIAGRL